MLSKQKQVEAAAALSEKLAYTIATALRDDIGVTKEQANELKTKCYDSIFDIVVNTYRVAARLKQGPKET
jgi:hypothetical protein